MFGIADRRYDRVSHNREQGREFTYFEDHHEWNQNDKQRHRLQCVVDRAQKSRNPVEFRSQHTERDTDDKRQQHGQATQVNRQQRLRPYTRKHQESQTGKGSERKPGAAELPA